jgi:hypothetical protein
MGPAKRMIRSIISATQINRDYLQHMETQNKRFLKEKEKDTTNAEDISGGDASDLQGEKKQQITEMPQIKITHKLVSPRLHLQRPFQQQKKL